MECLATVLTIIRADMTDKPGRWAYPGSVVGALKRQQGEAPILGIADGDWQVWQITN